jgi:hypothetical protein
MTSISKAFPGQWYKATDLGGEDHTRTIKSADVKQVPSPWGPQTRCVIEFEPEEGMPPKYSCGKSVAHTIAEILGQDDCTRWTGGRITLYPTEERIQGSLKAVVRVRRGSDD